MDKDTLDSLVRFGAMDADMIAIEHSGTGHEMIRSVIRAALDTLFRNGLISLVPQDQWPEYVTGRSLNEIREMLLEE